MRNEYDDDYEIQPDLIGGSPASTDRDDALADLLLELVGGAAKVHAMLAQCSQAEYAAAAPTVQLLRGLVEQLPTAGRPRPRVGFEVRAPKARRKRSATQTGKKR